MKFNVIAYTMLILIALQSLATVTKTQEFHQVEPEHLALIHQLAPDHQSTSLINVNNDEQINTQADSHNPADCHHCGHCNGSHAHWVSISCTRFNNHYIAINQYAYQHNLADGTVNRLIRPPKA